MSPIAIRPIAADRRLRGRGGRGARPRARDFVDRLDAEWRDGSNRFTQAGEVLFGAFDGDRLVGVGGLNRDPYVAAPHVGRLRHLYVLSAWRRRGVGAALIGAVIDAARGRFACVRLRTVAPAAARLYERMGFVAVDDATATHVLSLTTAGR
jgi:GNAT superfamily N-acetyltransferase